MTQRPGSASCAGLPGAGGAAVTTLPIARAADSCRRPNAASVSGYVSGARGLIAPAGRCRRGCHVCTSIQQTSIAAYAPRPSYHAKVATIVPPALMVTILHFLLRDLVPALSADAGHSTTAFIRRSTTDKTLPSR